MCIFCAEAYVVLYHEAIALVPSFGLCIAIPIAAY